MARTLVVVDIHGGKKALLQVLEKASLLPDDQLIFVGDYVDGWSESAQVILYLSELARKQPCIFLKGNHDEWYEHWLRTGQANEVWLQHGGISTIKSTEKLSAVEKDIQLEFMAALRYYYIDDQRRCYLHAGFTSGDGPAMESDPSQLAMDRSLWKMALSLSQLALQPETEWPIRLQLFSAIFIGHTPTINVGVDVPLQAINVWNVDTGAAFTGCLSMLDADTKTYWQSDPVHELYPEEKGRN